MKRGFGTVRIDPELKSKVEKLLDINNNRVYCDSLASFINMAVSELLENIGKKENKIRLKLK